MAGLHTNPGWQALQLDRAHRHLDTRLTLARVHRPTAGEPAAVATVNCTMLAQVPIENRSEQGQFAELPLKAIGKVRNLGDYTTIEYC